MVMPPFPVNRRDGLPTILKVARELCRLLTKFTPKIIELYPDNTALHDALNDAAAVCAVLVVIVDAAVEPGL